MKYLYSLIILILILVTCILSAGCSSYAEPEIKLKTSVSQVNASPNADSITYDVAVTISNTGSNNAYNMVIMLILGTPKDLPEYRFITQNVEIGTVPKGETVTVTKSLVLPTTRENFEILSVNKEQPEVEAKVIRVTSNIMG